MDLSRHYSPGHWWFCSLGWSPPCFGLGSARPVRVGNRQPCSLIVEPQVADMARENVDDRAHRWVVLAAAPHQRPCPQRCRMDYWAPHQAARLGYVLALRVVEHWPSDPTDMLEKRWPRDSPVVDAQCACTGIRGELFTVAIPRRPGRLVCVEQHHGVPRVDRRGVRADA